MSRCPPSPTSVCIESELSSPSTMEFLDDERPRFLFQSRSINPATIPEPHSLHNLNKPFVFITTSISILLIALSVLYVQIEPFQSLLLWAALSLFLGPIAPSNLTAGDIRVGRGPIVQFPDPETDSEPEGKKKPFQRRSRAAASDAYAVIPEISNGSARSEEKIAVQAKSSVRNGAKEEEKEWSEEDFETLRKQLMKHPVGKPRRWEIITEAFNGAHKVETVIKKSKELGNRKVTDKDSYAQFLKNRKPLDKQVDGDSIDSGSNEEVEWSSGEDIALLNALKAFPKEAPMRWEKITAAVPGKTKASCMKRVTDLKKGFRSSKAAKE